MFRQHGNPGMLLIESFTRDSGRIMDSAEYGHLKGFAYRILSVIALFVLRVFKV
jgi:hypothetical protein